MGWIGAAVVGYLVLLALLFAFQRSLLYQPSRALADPAMAGSPAPRLVELETRDGLSLVHWYWPAERHGAPTVVVFHGNAGHVGHRADKHRFLREAGFGLLLAGYRGYGGNEGSPSEPDLTADGAELLAWLAGQGVLPRDTVLYGESLGTALAVKLAAAAEAPYAGVILEAPYTSIAAVAQAHYWYVPAYWLVRDRWDAAAVVAGIGAPLLVLHGERDRIVPTRFGRALFAAAAEPKDALWLSEAGHNDLLDTAEARTRIKAFLGQ